MAKLKNDELAERAGLGSRNSEEPTALDVEREPMPDAAPEATSNIVTQPPARSGPGSEATQKPTEGSDKDNPVHHTGRMPPPRVD
ncbi:hypothetical protein [Shinella sumterensis]|uniref:hypothetical protein n=1 Tax=Shinella sumterensis TaxID=1967501 RepID=UPI003F849411